MSFRRNRLWAGNARGSALRDGQFGGVVKAYRDWKIPRYSMAEKELAGHKEVSSAGGDKLRQMGRQGWGLGGWQHHTRTWSYTVLTRGSLDSTWQR